MSESEVGEAADEVNRVMESRGLDACPAGCECDYTTRCGEDISQ
jgi:hypothetical protein